MHLHTHSFPWGSSSWKLFASWNRWCSRTNICAYFRMKWQPLFKFWLFWLSCLCYLPQTSTSLTHDIKLNFIQWLHIIGVLSTFGIFWYLLLNKYNTSCSKICSVQICFKPLRPLLIWILFTLNALSILFSLLLSRVSILKIAQHL